MIHCATNYTFSKSPCQNEKFKPTLEGNFVGENIRNLPKFRHYSPTKFSPIRYFPSPDPLIIIPPLDTGEKTINKHSMLKKLILATYCIFVAPLDPQTTQKQYIAQMHDILF